MRKSIPMILMLLALTTFGCQQAKQGESAEDTATADSLNGVLDGDSTIYGLACDGCTDTILVFLPLNNIESDPDTFNILNASRKHRVLGRPTVGERVAVVRNPNDSTVADYVIVMDDLYGSWCYQVFPTLRQRVETAGMSQKQLLKAIPDSIKEALKVSREYGMQLSGNHEARPIGAYRPNEKIDEEDPIEYPSVKRYREWRLYNGKLLLTEKGIDSTGNQRIVSIDTAEFLLMGKDTLVLSINKELRSFYRKKKE